MAVSYPFASQAFMTRRAHGPERELNLFVFESTQCYDIFMSNDDIMSDIKLLRPNDCICALLVSYGAHRGGMLPGSWFVTMLDTLRISASATRQALYRMVSAGTLTAEQNGTFKLYSLTQYGLAGTDAGTARFHSEADNPWDGHWVIVNYQFSSEERVQRDLVRSILEFEGFASLSRGTLIHPRDRTHGVVEMLKQYGLEDSLTVFRAKNIGNESDTSLVHRLWDVDALSKEYKGFIKDYSRYTTYNWNQTHPAEAIRVRIAFGMRFLGAAWCDPGLPAILLTKSWPAARARKLARQLAKKLQAPLLSYGDAVLRDLPDFDIIAGEKLKVVAFG